MRNYAENNTNILLLFDLNILKVKSINKLLDRNHHAIIGSYRHLRDYLLFT